MTLFSHRAGALDARLSPTLTGFEAGIFDRSGRMVQRELLRVGSALRRFSMDLPGNQGLIEAFLNSQSMTLWMRGGSPAVVRALCTVPEDTEATLELCVVARRCVAELSLTDAAGFDVTDRGLEADGRPSAHRLVGGTYVLRAWAFEGDVAVRLALRTRSLR